MANGPRKERILTDPKFARTRENIAEFGGVALMVNSLHKTFKKVANLRDAESRTRTTKVLNNIKKLSEGIRGQRTIQLSKHRDLLKNMEMNSVTMLSDVLAARIIATHTAERTSASVTLQESSIREMVTAPSNGTHFRILHFLGAVADAVYDPVSSKYMASDLLFNTVSNVTFSDYLLATANQELAVTLETSLPNLPPPGENVSLIQGVGIIFYEQIGDIYYPFTENSAMKIIDVF
jgi:hypothetical protein